MSEKGADNLTGRAARPLVITEPKVLVAEGRDIERFCDAAVRAYRVSGFQVLDAGGIAQIPDFVRVLPQATGFLQNASSVVVFRDAETSASSAAASIRDALRRAGLPVPAKPFAVQTGEFQTGAGPRPLRTAFAVFPGLDDSGELLPTGKLEDLCLATIREPSLLACVDPFLECCHRAGSPMKHRSKMRVHAYLAGTGRAGHVGMKIGEAATAGAWDWGHPRLRPFRDLLSSL